MLVEPPDRRFFGSTRGRVVALLRREALTADQLASALHVSDSAIRVHLTSLERDGLVQRGPQRRGAGKPAYAYQLTAEAERLFPKAYEQTLDELLAVLRQHLPADAVAAIVRETGSRIGAQAEGAPGVGSDKGHGRRSALERAAAVFGHLGGLPRIEERDGVTYLHSDSCPLAGLVARHPQVCDLAQALLSRVAESPVQQVCPRGEPPRCSFRFAFPPT